MTQWSRRTSKSGDRLKPVPRSPEPDSVRWPVDGEDLADQVAARHRPPLARVARLRAVVAHHEVLALRDRSLGIRGTGVAPVVLYIRLNQLLAVDVDEPVLFLPGLARQGDQPLDERAAGAA